MYLLNSRLVLKMDLLARGAISPQGGCGVTVRAVFAGVLVFGHTTHQHIIQYII
nr:MAG TPA: hypothetical protein [Caudoviricetes sp.]